MFGESRVFWLPKDLAKPKGYEDSYCFDAKQGVAAVADGVSGGIFSDRWANILTRATVMDPPDLEDAEGFRNRLATLREAWSRSIDFSRLGFFQRRKLDEVGGGFATLLWLELFPIAEDDPRAATETFRYLVHAVGDCCLFHVRDGETLQTFPMVSSSQFGSHPSSIASADLNQDHSLEFKQFDDYCRTGDLFALSSDAIAETLLQFLETNRPIDWEQLLSMDGSQWYDWIGALRAERGIEIDDTTLVFLRVAEPAAEDDAGESAPGAIVWAGELAEATEGSERPTGEPDSLDIGRFVVSSAGPAEVGLAATKTSDEDDSDAAVFLAEESTQPDETCAVETDVSTDEAASAEKPIGEQNEAT